MERDSDHLKAMLALYKSSSKYEEKKIDSHSLVFIDQAINAVEKLEKEARVLAFRSRCPHPEEDCPIPEPNDAEFCVRCKREAARKAAEEL